MKEMFQNKAIVCVGVLMISILLFSNIAETSGTEIVSNNNSKNVVVMEKSL